MTVLLVALGAAVGAPLRYLTDRFFQSRLDPVFPWGTLAVNVVGSFVLGMVTAWWVDGRVGDDVVGLVGMGFCGALTTYSTFSYETLRLLEDSACWYALANVAVSMVAGVAAAVAGWAIAA